MTSSSTNMFQIITGFLLAKSIRSILHNAPHTHLPGGHVNPMPSYMSDGKKTDPDIMYRGILERTIELLWAQQAHAIEMKIREGRIRRKTNQSVPKLHNIIRDTNDVLERQFTVQAERFWGATKKDHKLPLSPKVVQHLMDNWKKIDQLVDNDLQKRDYIETECEEIKEEMYKAMKILPYRYEEIKNLTTILENVKLGVQKVTLNESISINKEKDEWKELLRNVRRNGTSGNRIQ